MFLTGDESSLWQLPDGEDSTIVNASLVRLNGENKITLRVYGSGIFCFHSYCTITL